MFYGGKITNLHLLFILPLFYLGQNEKKVIFAVYFIKLLIVDLKIKYY
ncbi:hypothetical protein Murru_0413 [Allomuricauda ruestringensis DSM 13258]|uniref:Uncharacterized protein n=1 Tax=Allomuricauda ruestringensis (strain DSM 13258 / CIP 107369 / LMG 19739 / B1) TaxID=886377 RepID=G2PRL8_ALLRU|nr:hypothetical protein Murru_0413 [Allomuricauda ruestringensis DSM 13258]